MNEQYAMTQQLRRAAYSIPSNIAEGCGKDSQKEFARYLSIVSGSIKEVENFLILSNELGYVEKQLFEELSANLEKIAKMNHKLLSTVRNGT